MIAPTGGIVGGLYGLHDDPLLHILRNEICRMSDRSRMRAHSDRSSPDHN
jgi:hypothetical protein